MKALEKITLSVVAKCNKGAFSRRYGSGIGASNGKTLLEISVVERKGEKEKEKRAEGGEVEDIAV